MVAYPTPMSLNFLSNRDGVNSLTPESKGLFLLAFGKAKVRKCRVEKSLKTNKGEKSYLQCAHLKQDNILLFHCPIESVRHHME